MSRHVLLFSIIHLGCASGQSINGWEYYEDVDPVVAVPEPCGHVFSPDEATAVYVAEAVVRWSVATGCDIRIGEGGLPVDMVPELVHVETGTEYWGVAWFNEEAPYAISISARSPHPWSTTAHEIGHVLSWPALSHDDGGHSASGLMASPINDSRIDEESLELVCHSFPCENFVTDQ